jgi:hypothetical protein
MAFSQRTNSCYWAPTAFYRVPTEFLLASVCALTALPLRALRFHDALTALTDCCWRSFALPIKRNVYTHLHLLFACLRTVETMSLGSRRRRLICTIDLLELSNRQAVARFSGVHQPWWNECLLVYLINLYHSVRICHENDDGNGRSALILMTAPYSHCKSATK